MNSSIHGGTSHIRYGHTCRPRVLHVKCPACGSKAVAEKASEKGGAVLVGDLSPSWRLDDWEIACLNCPTRQSGISYQGLPELYYSGAPLGIWAWNTDHLAALRDYLSRKLAKDSPYGWLMTYVPGHWKKNSEKAVKIIQRLIAG